jgi:hypothetical protein
MRCGTVAGDKPTKMDLKRYIVSLGHINLYVHALFDRRIMEAAKT